MSLPRLRGNAWMPNWVTRWESHASLHKLKAAEIMLWLQIHSICHDGKRPCYASRETFGNEYTVGRRLRVLRDHSLLFDVRRPPDQHTREHRTTLRWTCDPLQRVRWELRIEEQLHDAAEQGGLSSGWYYTALKDYDLFKRRSARLARLFAREEAATGSGGW